MQYADFIASKRSYLQPSGFDVGANNLHPALMEFQGDTVRYLLRVGRGAAFEECGLGKTIQGLEWDYQIVAKTRKLVLVLCPLAVSQQTLRESERFKIFNSDFRESFPIGVYSSQDEVPYLTGAVITNYEKLNKFDPSRFVAVDLDESSILKSFNGKTKQVLCKSFYHTPFKLCRTATPAPNDLLELGNHAEFLGVMPSSEMIARWFINDTAHVGKYRLKHYAEADFWTWVSSWAVSLSTPADLGYSDAGYVLPEMTLYEHEVDVEDDEPPVGHLFSNESINATSIHKEKRKSVEARAEVVAGLVNGNNDTWIVWCDTDYEADALAARIPEAIEVRGSYPDKKKERLIEQFSTGQARVIITKPEICGHGLNWQHCHKAAFVGLSYSFERFYQAVRRILRFGQKFPVDIHVVNSPVESVVWRKVKQKELQHRSMQSKMSFAMRDAQMEFVRGIRKVTEYEAGREILLPSWVKSRSGV